MLKELEVFDDGMVGLTLDDEECKYDDKVDFYMNYIFGLCMRGDPRETLQYIYTVLYNIDNNLVNERDFVYYLLDKGHLINHSSSIRCCSLSNKGRKVMYDLMSILEEPK